MDWLHAAVRVPVCETREEVVGNEDEELVTIHSADLCTNIISSKIVADRNGFNVVLIPRLWRSSYSRTGNFAIWFRVRNRNKPFITTACTSHRTSIWAEKASLQAVNRSTEYSLFIGTLLP